MGSSEGAWGWVSKQMLCLLGDGGRVEGLRVACWEVEENGK